MVAFPVASLCPSSIDPTARELVRLAQARLPRSADSIPHMRVMVISAPQQEAAFLGIRACAAAIMDGRHRKMPLSDSAKDTAMKMPGRHAQHLDDLRWNIHIIPDIRRGRKRCTVPAAASSAAHRGEMPLLVKGHSPSTSHAKAGGQHIQHTLCIAGYLTDAARRFSAQAEPCASPPVGLSTGPDAWQFPGNGAGSWPRGEPVSQQAVSPRHARRSSDSSLPKNAFVQLFCDNVLTYLPITDSGVQNCLERTGAIPYPSRAGVVQPLAVHLSTVAGVPSQTTICSSVLFRDPAT